MICRERLAEIKRDAVRGLLGSLEPFRAIRGTMPLQYVVAILLVAEQEGLHTPAAISLCGRDEYPAHVETVA
jgi:hypothetical protein